MMGPVRPTNAVHDRLRAPEIPVQHTHALIRVVVVLACGCVASPSSLSLVCSMLRQQRLHMIRRSSSNNRPMPWTHPRIPQVRDAVVVDCVDDRTAPKRGLKQPRLLTLSYSSFAPFTHITVPPPSSVSCSRVHCRETPAVQCRHLPYHLSQGKPRAHKSHRGRPR